MERKDVPTMAKTMAIRTILLGLLKYVGPCPKYLTDTCGHKWEARIGERARNISERARKQYSKIG